MTETRALNRTRAVPAAAPGNPMKSLADLSRADLAKIVEADGEVDPELQARLADLVRSHPDCAARIAELDAVAAEAGIPDSPWTALQLNRRLDRLLETEGWDDPAEVLGEQDPETSFLAELIRITEARAARSDDPARLLEVKERLITAEVVAFEQHLKPFARWLVLMSPEGAERVMTVLSMLYRWKHEP